MHNPVYIQINDTTQNSVSLDSITAIKYKEYTLPFDKIKKSIHSIRKNQEKVKYIKLANLIRLNHPDLYSHFENLSTL